MVESELKSIKETSTEIKRKLECFIESADKKYATKDQLKTFEDRCLNHQKVQRDWVKWTPQVISMLIALIAFTISIKG